MVKRQPRGLGSASIDYGLKWALISVSAVPSSDMVSSRPLRIISCHLGAEGLIAGRGSIIEAQIPHLHRRQQGRKRLELLAGRERQAGKKDHPNAATAGQEEVVHSPDHQRQAGDREGIGRFIPQLQALLNWQVA
jgi:hypothetical protein